MGRSVTMWQSEPVQCQSCGAPMALIESRRFFRCGHCGTFHFPETVEADGIRIVGHPADAPDCPLCKTPMAHALVDNDDPIDFCAKCRGILLPRATFGRVVNKRRAWATSPPAEPVPLEHQQLRRTLSCPRCAGHFETYPHAGPGNVVIDNCTKCDMIWLDFGEMRQIVDAPGKDRGSRHAAPVDDDYVRRGPYVPRDDDDDDGERPRRADPLGFLVDVIFKE
jgi:Zn-finger nucleic acid-binding protein